MNRLSAFFKGRDTHLGLFYPEHYLPAIFPNLAQADRAQEKLRHAGCGEEDVISVSREEVVHFAQDHWLEDGLWGFLMRWLSRLLGTEEPTRIRTWRRRRMARHSLPCTVPPRGSKLTRGDSLRQFTPW
jgi:hypothetical protein